ncbi:lipid IV(A) palmitoyltransferase PagP [Legionella israelensis]|nr:lipid IV(A) palmitoyltransferase PagP [Legionella israelensis]
MLAKNFFRNGFIFLLFFVSTSAYTNEPSTHCKHWSKWFKPACLRLRQIWTEGKPELYLSGYAWHNRYTYSRQRLKKYNELAWGGGLGKGVIDEKGNWHGLYAFAFLESHKKIEPIAGYAYLKMFTLNAALQPGIGITAFLTARPDINNYIPFPGILPVASLMVNRFTLAATYIPGRHDIGNVLFLFAKYTF